MERVKALKDLLTAVKGSNQSLAPGKKKVVALAAAEDAHVLESACQARALGIADFVLFGDVCAIREICARQGADPADFEIVAASSHDEAAAKAVTLVAQGGADSIMKGLLETSTIMKAVLDKEKGICTSRRLSHMGMFSLEAYHKPLFVTDAAVNIAPDLKRKKEIIENAVLAVRSLGITNPKVALICAKEKVDPMMPVTLEYEELVRMNRERILAGCVVDGPLAFDGAVSKKAAESKGITSPVAGDADIILCPNIEAGNVLYKSLTIFASAQVGGVLLGAKVPIILTSRSDSSHNKLLSIALGAAMN